MICYLWFAHLFSCLIALAQVSYKAYECESWGSNPTLKPTSFPDPTALMETETICPLCSLWLWAGLRPEGLFPWVGQWKGSQPRSACHLLAWRYQLPPTMAMCSISFKSFHICWGSHWAEHCGEMGAHQWTRRPGPVLWEPVYGPTCRAWGIPGPQSNSSDPHAFHQTQEARATGVGSKNIVGFLWERPTLLPETKPHGLGLQVYSKPLNSYEHIESCLVCCQPLPSLLQGVCMEHTGAGSQKGHLVTDSSNVDVQSSFNTSDHGVEQVSLWCQCGLNPSLKLANLFLLNKNVRI